MKIRTPLSVCLSLLLMSLSLGASAQQSAPAELAPAVALLDPSTQDAPDIIFSNLDSAPDARFNSDISFSIYGRDLLGDAQTETWLAMAFTTKSEVRAKVLMAAIGYISGTKLVKLGLYNDNPYTLSVGSPVPGGGGSTTEMPDEGACCDLAKVYLPGEGALLKAHTRYWLVAGPDNINAGDFHGGWALSNRGKFAQYAPPTDPWGTHTGAWGAAEIRGTRVENSASAQPGSAVAEGEANDSDDNFTIFSSLGPDPSQLYLAGTGNPVNGNKVLFQIEIWEALPFTPKTNVHVKTLAAAIGHVSGTALVNLSLYTDSGGTVGAPIPGAQGSTTEIPELDYGNCCQLTKVTLPDPGVALTAGTQYWLVASPDDVAAPTFQGGWQDSPRGLSAYKQPEWLLNWGDYSGDWLAAEIRGTRP